MRRMLAASLALTVLTSAACSAKSDGGAPSTAPAATNVSVDGNGFGAQSTATSAPANGATSSASSCAVSALKTKTAGELTVATDSPAYPPWFEDNKPTNGKGFESAVAYAVAKRLGYATDKVKWVKETFDSAIAPTPKSFDFDINEFSITAARAKVVDFSTGYYDVTQAVVALKSDKYANATSLAQLKSAKLGAQQGTTSFDAINDVIKPDRTPAEYPSNDLAVAALKNGQIDGLVVDLPTAFYVTSAQVDGSTIVGQVATSGAPEQFGLLLDKGSPLTTCVSAAVDTLRGDGTLKSLAAKWLTTAGDAPVLK